MPRWIFLLPLLLPACVAAGPDREVEAAQAALASHRASLEALGAGASAPVAPQPSRSVPGRVAAQGATAPRIQTPRAPSALLGASPEAVRATLGEPLMRREEGVAQIWLYSTAGCQIDIVLYSAEGGPRVAHVQARAGGLAQRTEASCLRDLASQGAAHHQPPEPSLPAEFGA
ncbi:hypothetical protein [Roseococcus sp. YIM B11640]|uniref:hypothetical protein n=1 Tax=Roseococcus sp. YIM B11640 TaxID=3133973 RepID=UPI003C7B5B8E